MNIRFFNFFLIFGFLLLSACTENVQQKQAPQMTGSVSDSHSPYQADNWGADTFHAIIVTDTNDRRIGKSVAIDLEAMRNLVGSISKYTGLVLSEHYISGNQFTYHNVTTALNRLSIGNNDAVLFYYAGHGYNANNRSRWPVLDTKSTSRLSLNSVVQTLKSKKPRFFLVIADTCNTFMDRLIVTESMSGSRGNIPNAENYKRLFLHSRGHIVASGAKPGQSSWSNSQVGGFFTYQFLGQLDNALVSSHPPSWKNIMMGATKRLDFPNGVIQQPQYKINIEGESQVGGTQAAPGGGKNDREFEWLLDRYPSDDQNYDLNKWHWQPDENERYDQRTHRRQQSGYDRSKWQ